MPRNNIAIHDNPVLTKIFLGYDSPESSFIRSDILPVIPISSQAGQLKVMEESTKKQSNKMDEFVATHRVFSPVEKEKLHRNPPQ